MSRGNSRAGQHKQHRPWKVVFWPRRLQAPAVTTIIVDTDTLIDRSQTTVTTHPHGTTKETVLQAAGHALSGTTGAEHQSLRDSLPSPQQHPVASFNGTIQGTAWHHGDSYVAYWCGPVESTLHHCDMTDNERDHVMTQARRLASEDKLVYAIAKSIIPATRNHAVEKISPHEATFLGLLSSGYTFRPNLHASLIFCKQKSIELIYASTDDELTTTTIARATGLLSPGSLPERYSSKRPLTNHARCYARLSPKLREKLIAQFDPATTIIADKPLSEIVRTIVVR